MKKPASGKKKQVKHRNARKRFVSKAQKAIRLNRHRAKLVEKANIEKKRNEELMGLISEYNDALQEAQSQAEKNETQEQTNEALFDNEEPKED